MTRPSIQAWWEHKNSVGLPHPMERFLPSRDPLAQRVDFWVASCGGPQVDSQVKILDDLAKEMILDTAVKEEFFSTGDIFFDIARRLEAAAIGSETEPGNAAEKAMAGVGFGESARGKGRFSRREIVAHARLVSAMATVLDAAFFHSMQCTKTVDLVGRPKATSLPVVSDNLLCVYCTLQRRILSFGDRDDGGHGIAGSNALGGGVSFPSFESILPGSWEEERTNGMLPQDFIMTGILDNVVRALNGMSDVSVVDKTHDGANSA